MKDDYWKDEPFDTSVTVSDGTGRTAMIPSEEELDKITDYLVASNPGDPNYNGSNHAIVADAIEALRAEVDRFKQEHQQACELVAKMHAAAVGEVTGPRRGVVEDVEDLRAEVERLRGNAGWQCPKDGCYSPYMMKRGGAWRCGNGHPIQVRVEVNDAH